MGILKLFPSIEQWVPSAMSHMKALPAYAGQRFAVEVSGFMYKFQYGVQQAELDPSVARRAMCRKFVEQHTVLKEAGVRVVYVFDGKAPESKARVLQDRKRRRDALVESIQRVEEKLHDGTTTEEQKVELEGERRDRKKRLLRFSHEDFSALVAAFVENDMCYVKAEAEGEKHCAQMCAKGEVDYVLSDDSDCLAYGAPKMIRWYGGMGEKTPQVVVLQEVLTGLKLTMNEFVDLCILMGCDHCTKIAGIGPTKARQIIEKYRSIEAFLKTLWPAPKNFPYVVARHEFSPPLSQPKNSEEEIPFAVAPIMEEGAI